jgi:hypothetical protein
MVLLRRDEFLAFSGEAEEFHGNFQPRTSQIQVIVIDGVVLVYIVNKT